MGALQDLLADKLLEERLAAQSADTSYTPGGQEGSTPYDEDMLARLQGLLSSATPDEGPVPTPSSSSGLSLKDFLGDAPGAGNLALDDMSRSAASMLSGMPLIRDAADYAVAVPDWVSGLVSQGGENPSLRKYAQEKERVREGNVAAHEVESPLMARAGKYAGAAEQGALETITGAGLLRALGIASAVPSAATVATSAGISGGLTALLDQLGYGTKKKGGKGMDEGERQALLESMKSASQAGGLEGVPEIYPREAIRAALNLGPPQRSRVPALVMRGDKQERIEEGAPVGGYSKDPEGTSDIANRRYGGIVADARRRKLDPRIRVAEMQLQGEMERAKGTRALEFAKLERQNFDRLAQMKINDPDTLVSKFAPGTKAKDITLDMLKQLGRQQTLEQMGQEGGGELETRGAGPQGKVPQDEKDYQKGSSVIGKTALTGLGVLGTYGLARWLGMGPLATNLLKKIGIIGAEEAPEVIAPFTKIGEYTPFSASSKWTASNPWPRHLLEDSGQMAPRTATGAAREWAERLRGVKAPVAGPQKRLPYLPSEEKGFITPAARTTTIGPTPEERDLLLKEIAEGYKPVKGSEEYHRLNRIKAVFRERAQLPAVRDPKSGLQYQTIKDVRNFSRKELESRLKNLKKAANLEEDIPGVPHEDLLDHIADLQSYLRKNKGR